MIDVIGLLITAIIVAPIIWLRTGQTSSEIRRQAQQ